MGRKHSVPVFLFHPLVFALPKKNFDQVPVQGDRCEVFCGNELIIFGVINSEWRRGRRHSLSAFIVSISFLTGFECIIYIYISIKSVLSTGPGTHPGIFNF